MPPMDPKDETIKLGSVKRPVRRRKREIRVFVSSTFRDFTKEREELIKKTFREVCIKRNQENWTMLLLYSRICEAIVNDLI